MSIHFGAFPDPMDKTIYDTQEEAEGVAQAAFSKTGVYKYVVKVKKQFVVRSYSDLWVEYGGPDKCVIVATYEK